MAGQTTKQARPVRRLGIYGGTFDPVHHGHLILARDAQEQLGLDLVLLVPCAVSPHKSRTQTRTEGKRRAAMIRAAIRGRAGFGLSTCELERPAPSYSIDTAEELQQAHPQAELFWLIGDDQLPKLRTWVRYDRLRQIVSFAAMARGRRSGQRLPAGVIRLPRRRRVDISASEIRQRVHAGLPIDHLVPAPVAAYIDRHQLYRK